MMMGLGENKKYFLYNGYNIICVMSYIHIGTRFNLPHMFVQWVVCNFKFAIYAIIYIMHNH